MWLLGGDGLRGPGTSSGRAFRAMLEEARLAMGAMEAASREGVMHLCFHNSPTCQWEGRGLGWSEEHLDPGSSHSSITTGPICV